MLDKDLISIAEAREMVKKAKAAQLIARELSQTQIDEAVKRMAEAGERAAGALAQMAHEETGYGKVEDKVIKNTFASRMVYAAIKDMKTVGVVREDPEKGLMEVAVPVGVIAGLVPSTNPTSTAIYKSLICVKSANAIILSPHPAARGCIAEACRILREALEGAGLPADLVQCMGTPHMAGTHELMTHPDVNLILATGGRDMVKAAYSSGIPSLGVGPGNVPAFIERSADIPAAVARIISSKTFDNGVICASEQSVVTEDCIKDAVLAELERQGCYLLNDEEGAKVGSVVMRAGGKLNPGIVGKDAVRIARMAGVEVPPGTRVLVYAEKGVGPQYPFSIEKLSPTLGFYSEKDWHAACERCIELLNFGGLGHSLVIHSENQEVIREFALKKPVSRMLVNTPSSQGAIGYTTNLVPALTLGCGSVGGTATSDNISPLHLINIRRVAYGTDKAPEKASAQPNIEEITRLVIEALKSY